MQLFHHWIILGTLVVEYVLGAAGKPDMRINLTRRTALIGLKKLGLCEQYYTDAAA